MNKVMNVEIYTTLKNLPFFKALASDTRLKIIELLSEKPMNVSELAQKLGMSSAVVTNHINKLEKAGIIKSVSQRGIRGAQKVCSINIDYVTLIIKKTKENTNYYHFSIPVGQYIDFDVKPTCGLATTEKLIGMCDDPKYFADPEHIHASIIWFRTGYVTYSIPNYLLSTQEPEMLEIVLEICSEAPGGCMDWPSDITFYVNDIKIGTYTSPADFNDRRGLYTPSWWSDTNSQYGLLKRIMIGNTGSFIDGKKVSDVKLSDIKIKENRYITFKIAVHEDAIHPGGVTIFGKGFGNYDVNIEVKVFFRQVTN